MWADGGLIMCGFWQVLVPSSQSLLGCPCILALKTTVLSGLWNLVIEWLERKLSFRSPGSLIFWGYNLHWLRLLCHTSWCISCPCSSVWWPSLGELKDCNVISFGKKWKKKEVSLSGLVHCVRALLVMLVRRTVDDSNGLWKEIFLSR